MISDIPAGDGKLVNLFLQCRKEVKQKERGRGGGKKGGRGTRIVEKKSTTMRSYTKHKQFIILILVKSVCVFR